MLILPRLWSEPVLPPLGPEDEDVANERERVKSNRTQGDILTVRDLSKVCKIQILKSTRVCSTAGIFKSTQ